MGILDYWTKEKAKPDFSNVRTRPDLSGPATADSGMSSRKARLSAFVVVLAALARLGCSNSEAPPPATQSALTVAEIDVATPSMSRSRR